MNPTIRRRLRLGAIAAVLAGQALLAPAAAHAVTLGEVYQTGGTLRYDAGNMNNTVIVSRDGSTIVFTDTVDMIAGTNCGYPVLTDHRRVACSASGVTAIRVNGNGGADYIDSNVDLPSTLWGGADDDNLMGGPADDILRGDGGADRMVGGPGRDGVTYYGYSGNVTADLDGVRDDGLYLELDLIGSDVEDLYGGDGDDVLTGNSAANYFHGNDGDDTIRGLGGEDNLHGGYGSDDLYAGDGDDTVYAGPDADYADGGIGADAMYGDTGDDSLYGNYGIDVIFAEEGNDLLRGGPDLDHLHGGDGGDVCDDTTVIIAISCE